MDELRAVSPDGVLAAPLPRVRKSTSRRHNFVQAAQGLLMHLLVWVGAIATVVPFLWMISTSLKSQGGAMAFPPEWIPNPIHWENYPAVIESFPFGLFAFNSAKIAILGTLGQLASTS